ncbi:helix-turn-helix domain-containing protein [Streptomyces sp. SID13666]|nr:MULTISPECIES: helix-turn-helix transcriptional regulator [unclassified Streptomyces]NEA54215.1 helix-turn-helix domain-containing protein [Streptomyces sp. SID13666]NEA70310.1 helix-turn-helix domain-containing protein [Streptomyces sp. SID13588]
MRERDEIARLLGELKSRSGLSYGALAKRLHLSTSTLHRYCTGDVVPTEFAPLDHLARLCRATPQELVELYRLWVVVRAVRGTRTSSGSEPSRPTGPTEATGATGATGPTEARAEAQAGPEAQATPDGRGDEAGPVPAARAEPDPVPRAVPPRWRVRHRGILAAAAVAVVLATIGAVATGLESATGSDTDPGRATAGGSSSGSPAAGGLDSSSSSPALASAGAGPGAGSPGPSGGTDTSAPIKVSVKPSGWDTPCDQYLVDRPPSEVPRPPQVPDVAGWVSRLGAVPGPYLSIEIVVQGTSRDTVVLSGLNVRVARSAAPLAWNAYSMGEGCGGGVDVHSYDLDLDAARPRPVVTEGSTGLPLKVSEGDPEVIEITARTTAHDVSWYLELEWSSGDRKGTLPVDLGHGTPFRISAVKGRPLYVHPIGGQAWEPSPFQR